MGNLLERMGSFLARVKPRGRCGRALGGGGDGGGRARSHYHLQWVKKR